MAITKMDLMNLLRNVEGGDVHFLREGVRVLAQALMEVDVASQVGAEHGEHARRRSRAAAPAHCWRAHRPRRLSGHPGDIWGRTEVRRGVRRRGRRRGHGTSLHTPLPAAAEGRPGPEPRAPPLSTVVDPRVCSDLDNYNERKLPLHLAAPHARPSTSADPDDSDRRRTTPHLVQHVSTARRGNLEQTPSLSGLESTEPSFQEQNSMGTPPSGLGMYQ